MVTDTVKYYEGNTPLHGFIAYDDQSIKKRPAILIAHDWSGCNDFARNKAQKMAELGYIGFAMDIFGEGKMGATNEEKSALIKPFLDDRLLLQRRLFAALSYIQQNSLVDSHHIAAIGFCFGGLCVLDLARSGADIQGVVSFHGLFNSPEKLAKNKITAKILALHGYDDPMATPAQVNIFAEEMTAAQADWQIHMYGHTKHAFTNPLANDPNFGTVYNSVAEKRSWQSMKNFFNELFD